MQLFEIAVARFWVGDSVVLEVKKARLTAVQDAKCIVPQLGRGRVLQQNELQRREEVAGGDDVRLVASLIEGCPDLVGKPLIAAFSIADSAWYRWHRQRPYI
ncbi:MAG: hypothetical protein WDN04_11545 [Rhodospirillales bacterium]